MSIKVYTDGACKGNPGPGGWGALIMDGDSRKELYAGNPDTTNNQMEMQWWSCIGPSMGCIYLKYTCDRV